MNTKNAVLYLRVSTDDKDQNPERQHDILRDWCNGHGVAVCGVFADEGTSATKTNPFERPKFNMALEAAQANRAALLVTKVDRFTRQGSYELGWAVVEMKRGDRPVPLWVASKGGPEDQDREVIGALTDAIEAEQGAKWSRDHGEAVSSGMRTAAKSGKHMGRPPKSLSAAEIKLAQDLKDQGWGVRRIASEINRLRGCFSRADVAAAVRKHGVSKSLVHEYLSGGRAL